MRQFTNTPNVTGILGPASVPRRATLYSYYCDLQRIWGACHFISGPDQCIENDDEDNCGRAYDTLTNQPLPPPDDFCWIQQCREP